MEKSKISFGVRATGQDLTLVLRFDGIEVGRWTDLSYDLRIVSYEFNDASEQEHQVEIEMLGKIQDHTQVDESGNILSDRVIEIQNICLDDIELGYLFTEVAEYHHDGNGTQDPVTDKFFGTMGCNGVVRFRFTSPLYLWLLEHM